MKSVSIIAVAIFALVALSSSAPVAQQQVQDTRIDIYNDFLSGLFSGLVSTTFGTVSNFLNQLIAENPLGVGKRSVQDDVAARVNILSFLYDNILQDLFSGIVTNTFSTATNALNNLIQTNPLGIGKRDVEGDLAARVNILSFLYDNILQDLFSGIVTNTFTTATNALNNLIQTNPLGIGKRDVEGDLAARVDILSFLYDNILQDLFSGIVTNTFSTAANALNNLIQTNPLGLGKRAALDVNIFQFLYDNVIADLFGGLASNTANYLQNSLNNLLNKPFANVGKRSVNIQQAQELIAQSVSTLVQQFKTFAKQVIATFNDRQKFAELVKENVAVIKTTVAALAQQLAEIIPAEITNEISEGLALLQSVLVFWTSGLAGSLGPVLGSIRP
ncbi:unnamed protein product [Adineta ricciae]|uniref:Uncharacterized protein n=1 Tax=Adineta ricciae TaxID=249248 RepID=A0A814D552_ADIRI|nr:unnamed protein product [Adineta ricciae]CAF0950463.1 unnamed protein product [Adineta ricciae]